MLGNFHDAVCNIECVTNDTLWIVDENGVYIEQTAMQSSMESDCLAAINAKFGTNYTQLTMLQVSGIGIGDDCPNWEEYEKINLPAKENFRFMPTGSSAYLTGYVQGENAYMNTNDSEAVWNISPEGDIWGAGAPISTYSTQAKQLLLKEFGKEFDVINAFVENWVGGQKVPNWESYKILE